MTDLTLLWSGPNGDAAGLPDRRSDAACIGKRPLAMNGSLRLVPSMLDPCGIRGLQGDWFIRPPLSESVAIAQSSER